MAKNLLTKIKDKISKKADPMSGTSQMLDRYWNTAFGARSELDWKWFQYDLWYNGNHYARWDKNTQMIISTQPRLDGRPKVTINKVYSTLRGVRSHVLQNDPIAEVTPMNMTDQEVDQVMYLNRIMFYLHDHLHLRSSLRASMLHALKYSVGWWQVLWDENADDGKGGIAVNVVDPYDLYVDPVARLPKEARYMILAVRRSIDELRTDPKYKDADWDKIVGTDTLAASTLKSRILTYERGQYTFNDGQKEHGSVILKEFWYKDTEEVEEEKENEAGEKVKVKTTKPRIMLCAKVGDEIVRKPEDTGLDRLPFFRLCSDIEPLAMYGQGWCKNLVPLNRMLELNESSILEYNVIVNKGRFKMTKNAGVHTVVNQHGTFIEHKVGATVEPMDIPQLSPVIETQTERINRYIEDVGAQHDASMGRTPTGVKSGIGVETLMEGDSNNLSELTENTEEFLEDVYEYILFLLSQKLAIARNVITTTQTGEKMFFKIIGEQAQDDLKNQQAGQTIVIPQECTVDVKIASYMAFTQDGRQQAVQQLAALPQMVNLPPDIILKAYNIGPIADIVKDMRDEEQRQAQMQMQQEQQLQQGQGQQQMQQQAQQQQFQQQQQAQQAQAEQQKQQASQPQDAGMTQAIGFIKELIQAMDNGAKPPELPKKITPLFVEYLQHFLQSPECQQYPDLTQALHIYLGKAQLAVQGGGERAQA